METQFNSNQYNVRTDVLRSLFPVGIANTETLTLNSIRAAFKGYGYYEIMVDVEVNGMKASFKGDTNNMQVIDSWGEGEENLNEAIFESWAGVIDSLLYAVNFEERVEELAISSDEIRPNAREILVENYERSDIALEGLSLSDWVDSEMDGDPTFEAWLFYKAENVGDFGSSMTKRQKEALNEFLKSL